MGSSFRTARLRSLLPGPGQAWAVKNERGQCFFPCTSFTRSSCSTDPRGAPPVGQALSTSLARTSDRHLDVSALGAFGLLFYFSTRDPQPAHDVSRTSPAYHAFVCSSRLAMADLDPRLGHSAFDVVLDFLIFSSPGTFGLPLAYLALIVGLVVGLVVGLFVYGQAAIRLALWHFAVDSLRGCFIAIAGLAIFSSALLFCALLRGAAAAAARARPAVGELAKFRGANVAFSIACIC